MILIGTDPELFKKDHDGFIIPAADLIGGDVDVLLPWGRAYPDGAALEFKTPQAETPEQIVMQIGDNIRALVSEFGQLSVQSCASLNLNRIAASKGRGRGDMTVLGCAPDVRIYPWVEMPIRPDPKTTPYRSLGGHIHFGLPDEDGITLRQFITAFLDAVVGTSFTVIGDDEYSKQRHTLYGMSGTVRFKSYGVEYRTPPALVVRDPQIAGATFGTAFHLVEWVLRYWNQNKQDYASLLSLLGGVDGMRYVQESIDIYDVATCDTIRNNIIEKMQIAAPDYNLERYTDQLFNYKIPNFDVEW